MGDYPKDYLSQGAMQNLQETVRAAFRNPTPDTDANVSHVILQAVVQIRELTAMKEPVTEETPAAIS